MEVATGGDGGQNRNTPRVMSNHRTEDPRNQLGCICVLLTRWVSIVTITLPKAQICASNDDGDDDIVDGLLASLILVRS